MGVWSLVFGAMIPLGSLKAGAAAHWVGTSYALAFGADNVVRYLATRGAECEIACRARRVACHQFGKRSACPTIFQRVSLDNPTRYVVIG